VNGEVVLFADQVTQSIQALLNICEYRRLRQSEYNETHGITPQSVKRAVQDSLRVYVRGQEVEGSVLRDSGTDLDTVNVIRELEEEMQVAAQKLEFERAALIRDQINELKKKTGQPLLATPTKRRMVTYGAKGKKAPK